MGDVFGGFAAMLVALPSAIAFGISIYLILGPEYAARGAMAGIIGAVVIGIITPALGGAPRLISAPCAPAAAVMGALTGELFKALKIPPEQAGGLLTVVAGLSALLQILYGAVKGGRLIKYIPYPVVSGYLSGVGLLIFISQVPKFLGVGTGHSFWMGLANPMFWRWEAITIGTATIVGVVLAPRLTKTFPATIIGLISGLVAYLMIGLVNPAVFALKGNPLVIGPLFEHSSGLLGNLRQHWLNLAGVDFAMLSHLLVPALTLSVLLSIDTLKTCVVLDALTHSRHDSNRELMAQGIGNLASAAFGGMPGAGTMGATLVNLNSGGKTRLSGILEGVGTAVTLLLFGQLVGWIPIAALAGILIVVAVRMVDRTSFHLLRQRSTLLDFAVIAVVVIVAVAFNLIAASATGIILAIFLFIREQIQGAVIRRKAHGDQISSKQYRITSEKEILKQHGREITLCELQGSLFFGTTDKLFTELEPDFKTSKFLILDMLRVQAVDFTAVHMLNQIEDMLAEHGGFLLFSNLPPHLPTGKDLRTYFGQMGLVNSEQKTLVFESQDEALEWAEDRILNDEKQAHHFGEIPLELGETELMKGAGGMEIADAMAACFELRIFKTGETIFKQGDVGDELFLIRKGVVRIRLDLAEDRHYLIGVFGRGNFFGEITFLDRGHRTADAVAGADTELYVLSRSRFDVFARQNPAQAAELFARLARGLAIRLRYTDSELRALKEA